MDWFLVLLVGLAVGFAIGRAAGAARRPGRLASGAAAPGGDAPQKPTAPPAAPRAEPPAPPRPAAGAARQRLLQQAGELYEFYEVSAHPDDLTSSPAWNALVQSLQGEAFSYEDVLGYLVGSNSLLTCAAANAIVARPEAVGRERELVRFLESVSVYAGYFLLQVIGRVADPALAFEVLVTVNPSWSGPLGALLLRDFLRDRLDADVVQRDASRQRLKDLHEQQRGFLAAFAADLDTPGGRAVAAVLGRGDDGSIDVAALRPFARVLGAAEVADEPLPCATQETALGELRELVRREPARAALLVGEAGVGKATVVRRLARELVDDGWTVFEAGATELMAGQSYIGQLEGRVQELVRAIGGRPKVLWIAPGLAEFAAAGRHHLSSTGLLDLLLPHLLAGRLRVLAPLGAAAHEKVLRQYPMLRAVATTVRLPAAGAEETLALGRAWLGRAGPDGTPLCDDELLAEVYQRAQQHLVHEARPGCVLRLLELLRERVAPAGAAPRQATADDLIGLLSRLTGLPAAVLDDRAGLDLRSVRRAFGERVLGQPEAVDCLVDRIAMLKAGLCDPRRPIGVFLFTGPTGTGKTELCRALAEYLFGAADRMLRLDMSEFQHPESIGRLLGDADDEHGRQALVHRIREQPFAVVLLDEIEKAHPMVFDVFLQVFDEGRLTDRLGRAADFRHAIVVMTSNLGVRDLEGASLGFTGAEPDLQRALEGAFRREFLNRIDRIVVFRALDQTTLRKVLHKELDLVLQRRGLRNRQWAVEWDESALRFLLERGYTPELGARPLRRAIERYVLAPLAAAIVGEAVPEGDQFLFVRSDGRGVQVEFVDPDVEAPTPPPAEPVDRSLRELARDAQGRPEEVAAVRREVGELQERVRDETWVARKQAAYDVMNGTGFWTSPGRHEVLGRVELTSRVEQAVERAAERTARLAGDGVDAAAVRRLAARVMLLRSAIAAVERGEPQDAYLELAPVHDPLAAPDAARRFLTDLAAMYEAWARLRGMHWSVLGASTDPVVVAVSGFGALSVLAAESGLHVLDGVDPAGRPARVRVTVAAQPPEPAPQGKALDQARRALRAAEPATPVIVRRYRRSPTPEVRDRVHGWRTGRLDRVLGGEFDVMAD